MSRLALAGRSAVSWSVCGDTILRAPFATTTQVQTGMGKKRSDEGKAMWTKGPGSVQESFAALCKKI